MIDEANELVLARADVDRLRSALNEYMGRERDPRSANVFAHFDGRVVRFIHHLSVQTTALHGGANGVRMVTHVGNPDRLFMRFEFIL